MKIVLGISKTGTRGFRGSGEYKVTVKFDGKLDESSCYYTDDDEDAVRTLDHMFHRYNKLHPGNVTVSETKLTQKLLEEYGTGGDAETYEPEMAAACQAAYEKKQATSSAAPRTPTA